MMMAVVMTMTTAVSARAPAASAQRIKNATKPGICQAHPARWTPPRPNALDISATVAATSVRRSLQTASAPASAAAPEPSPRAAPTHAPDAEGEAKPCDPVVAGGVTIERLADQPDAGWQSISGTSTRVLPGQLIQLRFKPLGGAVLSEVEWAVPGKIFKDYVATASKGELTAIGANDLKGQSISFYWADSGSKEIFVTYKINGDTMTASVTIEVKKPTATLSVVPGTSVIGGNEDIDSPLKFLRMASKNQFMEKP